MRFKLFCATAVSALVISLATQAHAVVIESGDGRGNTDESSVRGYASDFNHWNNVGYRGGGGGIYLGNGWAATANHVGMGDLDLNGNVYRAVGGSQVNITSDLILYRIDGAPNLPHVTISTAAPAYKAPVIMIGTGQDHHPERTTWRVENGNWVQSDSGSYTGYYTHDSQTKRWGTNNVYRTNVNSGDMTFFSTRFDQNASPFEAQGVGYDSGGSVFIKQNGQWVLAGLMHNVTNHPGQPGQNLSAVYGNQTWMSDLSRYAGQINGLVGAPPISGSTGGSNPPGVPEPATLSLLGAGLAMMYWGRRKPLE